MKLCCYDKKCADCWESDCFGNCFEKCESCEFDGSEDCRFGQWCKYWDGHGIFEVSEEEKKKFKSGFLFLNDDMPF